MTQAKYQHDCDNCSFLANVTVPKAFKNYGYGDTMDLYHCVGFDDTVIARFGVDGDYMSGLFVPQSAAKNLIENGQSSTHREALEMIIANPEHLTTYMLSLAALKAMDAGLLTEDIHSMAKQKKAKP